MSALGHKRTFRPYSPDVRFIPESGHWLVGTFAKCQKRTHAVEQENTLAVCLYAKALSPVIALPTIKVFISRVPS
jgi:hypothetical protein